MKFNKNALKKFFIALIVATGFVACDKDFASIDSDIINEETAANFLVKDTLTEVIAYTNALGPVQTNGLGLATLGIYSDSNFGKTKNSFLTQLSFTDSSPDFGTNPVLDSVVLTIPYFSNISGVSEDGTPLYELDSIFPSKQDGDYKKLNINIYESNFFLRDFNPNAEFDESQRYFSNKSLSNSESISEASLKGNLLHTQNNQEISSKAIRLLDNNGELTELLTPGIRIVLDKTFWEEKIFSEEAAVNISNPGLFQNYFRGLYFEVEDENSEDNTMILFDITQTNSNITLYYKRDPFTAGLDRVESTVTLNFGPTRINFQENDFQIQSGDDINGDSRLFLKGGEGSTATIKLFQGNDVNGIDNFELFKKRFANYDDGEFKSYKRLINEANLVFYVDQEALNGQEEPERLYLYNKTEAQPLPDYFQDSQNNSLPSISIPNHLGILERADTDDEQGISYKMRITSHLNNLLQGETENIELGLAVSGNVNLEGTVPQYRELTSDNEIQTVPVSSLITPRGTVLHGNIGFPENKRLYLEIFYTVICIEKDEDGNCIEN